MCVGVYGYILIDMIRLVHSSTKLKAYTISVTISVQCLPECVVRECGQV